MKSGRGTHIGCGVAALALAVCGCGSPDIGGTAAGDEAPPFSLTAQDGRVVDSDSLRGQIVLLTFWSTTCGPCVRELPHLQQVDDSGRVKVVAVALDPGGWQTVRPFLDAHRVRLTVAVGDEELFERFDGYSLPHTLLLDRSMRVVKVYRGPVTRERIETDVAGIAPRG
jgi:thiol-disulfide isomerase/thioredoxin